MDLVDDDLEPSSDEVKEVYARFGLAYYLAEVLHRGLCNFYLLVQLPDDGRITRPRIEEHLSAAEDTTLGQLLLKLQPSLPDSLFQRLTHGAARRNFIAHSFWFERVHLLRNREGIRVLLTALDDDAQLFSELDEKVQQLSESLKPKLGLPDELFESVFVEVLRGQAIEPIIKQRKLRKEETVVRAFRMPNDSPDSGFALIFETADGVLWQLCDSGLGWSCRKEPDPTWIPDEELSRFLPAQIIPRPTRSAPWHFDLTFGTRAILSVRPGPDPGQILYTLRT